MTRTTSSCASRSTRPATRSAARRAPATGRTRGTPRRSSCGASRSSSSRSCDLSHTCNHCASRNTCLRESNCCGPEGTRRRAACALVAPHARRHAADVRHPWRARADAHADEDAGDAQRVRPGGLRQGALRAPRALAPSDEPHRRRASAPRLPLPHRGHRGPPHQAPAPHRRRPRRRRTAHQRAAPRPRGLCRIPLRRPARRTDGRAGRPSAPHERPGMTARIRLNEGNRRWWTLAAMCFALFMVMLDNTVVNVALPSIQKDLGATVSGLEWTVNAYTLAFAVLLVTGGRLGDIFGRRRMFLFGVVTFAASSAFIGFSQTEAWLVAGRAVQGLGAAFMMPGTLSIISNAFPPQERGKAIGTWAGISALALAIGPVVGGFLVENVSWQSIFFLNLPVAALAVVVTLLAADESRDETVERTVDVAGVATLTVGLAALVLALVEGNSWGWGSPPILALFAVAAAGLVGFVVIEMRTRVPMVDFTFFRSRSFLGANLVAFVTTFAMLAMFFFLALYMQNIKGYSPLQAGVRFLPSTLIIIVAGPIAGRLSDRIGPRPLMTGGLLLAAGSLFWQSFLQVDTSYGFLAGSFVLMGLGMGLIMSPMSTAAMNAVDRTKAGVASGILSMSRMVGGTFGVAVLGALVSVLGKHKLGELLPQAGAATREHLASSLGAGASGRGSPQVADAMRESFVYALQHSLKLGAAVAAAGAALAWWLVAPLPAAAAAPDVVVAGAPGEELAEAEAA